MAGYSVCAIAAATVLILLVAAPHTASEISCDDVISDVKSCAIYAYYGRGSPSSSCCNGVRTLNSNAATSTDRQQACNCLKNVINSYNFNARAVAGLPGKCGVNLQFTISTSTDCSKLS